MLSFSLFFREITPMEIHSTGVPSGHSLFEFGISYVSYPKLRAAVVAHLRSLKKLERKEPVPEVVGSLA